MNTLSTQAAPKHSRLVPALLSSNSTVVALLALMLTAIAAITAPWLLTTDPLHADPMLRLQTISASHWLGTDEYGRDLYARIVYGARISLMIGLAVSVLSAIFGLVLGTAVGYFRCLDAIVMRILDGLMAIPSILLAIALVALLGGSLWTVVLAISLSELPRVVRLTRSIALKTRSEDYINAAIALGVSPLRIMIRHGIPNVWAPLLVQGTAIFASSMITEAVLSFLGTGIPSDIPSWGNIMADGRSHFQVFPSLILYPGIALSLTILSVHRIADALRDAIDPHRAWTP